MARQTRILLVIGTRPEVIKTAPVFNLLKKTRRFRLKVCFTGQHRGMLEQMLRDFALPVDFHLRIMRPDQTLAGITIQTLLGLGKVYRRFHPDLVLIQGDTTSALAAAISAFSERIPVAHIEAGLRTFDKFRPYPEEVNRALISRLADYHFAPTVRARENLLKEGVPPAAVAVTGNTVIDALHAIRGKKLGYLNPRLRLLKGSKKIILVTMHRRESFGQPLANICRALRSLARAHPGILIAYPVHLNPNVSKPVRRILGGCPNIWLLPPLHYRDLVNLMAESYLILTDSGGIQEEAPSLGKPVLVLRDKTERPEGVRMGIARMVGSNSKKIVEEATRLIASPREYREMLLGRRKSPYGTGRAAERIVRALGRKLA